MVHGMQGESAYRGRDGDALACGLEDVDGRESALDDARSIDSPRAAALSHLEVCQARALAYCTATTSTDPVSVASFVVQSPAPTIRSALSLLAARWDSALPRSPIMALSDSGIPDSDNGYRS